MPTTPKCRECLLGHRLPNPMRNGPTRKRCLFFFWGGGRRSIEDPADQASPGSESNRRATQGTGKPFAASCVHPAVGPLVEEAIRGQGHRGAAPYGVEETKRAQGGRESEDFASDNEEEEVSSDEEADSKANQPNDKAAGVALRTQRGAAAAWDRPAAGARNARLATVWGTRG
jgi:hypothetical protein